MGLPCTAMAELHERDLAVLWHPATHFDDARELPAVPIVRAEGAWLHTADGRAILDGISSWWTSVHGHGHPGVVAAVAAHLPHGTAFPAPNEKTRSAPPGAFTLRRKKTPDGGTYRPTVSSPSPSQSPTTGSHPAPPGP